VLGCLGLLHKSYYVEYSNKFSKVISSSCLESSVMLTCLILYDSAGNGTRGYLQGGCTHQARTTFIIGLLIYLYIREEITLLPRKDNLIRLISLSRMRSAVDPLNDASRTV
jgi:hypothetical protein